MDPRNPETRQPHPRAKSAQYRVVNHSEAGLFDSMTGATIWAIEHVKDWDWQIETVTGRGSSEKCAPINLGIEDELLQNMPSEC